MGVAISSNCSESDVVFEVFISYRFIQVILIKLSRSMQEMKDKKELLAYCGFHCGDCLGYTGVIAEAAKDFKIVLDKYKFERTAKCVLDGKMCIT